MLDNYQDLIEELLGTPNEVRRLLQEDESARRLRLVETLKNRDQIVLERLQRMTKQTDPHLKGLPLFADMDAEGAEGAEGDSPAAILGAFETSRGDLISLLMNLTLRDWERTATHEGAGTVSLADEVELHVEFDEALRERLAAA